MAKEMTIMYLYYNQPECIHFLEAQGCPNWGVNFLFVDDGSKDPLKLDWAEVIRIDEDVPWNQPKANNFGFKHIGEGVVVRMDIDHCFKKEDLDVIKEISKEITKGEIYYFKRYATKEIHPNIYMAHVENLVELGGYDEDFCGNYGFDDIELVYRLNKKGFVFKIFHNIKMLVNKEGGTKGLNRDTTINAKLWKEKKQ